MKRILDWTPKIWGLIYILLIPTFAILYALMPTGSYHGISPSELWIEHIYNCIYFSVITITTLGYGDMFPLTLFAKTVVILETVFGMLTIGMFLNSVAMMKSKIDLEIETQKQDCLKKNAEILKLSRQYTLLKREILEYVRLTTKITTPGYQGNNQYTYNPNFKFQDLKDMYQITGQFKDSLSEPAINIYYRAQKVMANRLELVLTTVNLSYWPDLEEDILNVLHNIKIYDNEGFIVSQSKMSAGDKKLSESWMEIVKNWNEQVDYKPHSTINPYISLYRLIKANMPLTVSIMERIENIIEQDKV